MTGSTDAESMSNICLYDNRAEVVTAYRIARDQAAYFGGTEGGTGQQLLLLKGTLDVLVQVAKEPLK